MQAGSSSEVGWVAMKTRSELACMASRRGAMVSAMSSSEAKRRTLDAVRWGWAMGDR